MECIQFKNVEALTSIHTWHLSQLCISVKEMQPENTFSCYVFKLGFNLYIGILYHSILILPGFTFKLYKMPPLSLWYIGHKELIIVQRPCHAHHFLAPWIPFLKFGRADPKSLIYFSNIMVLIERMNSATLYIPPIPNHDCHSNWIRAHSFQVICREFEEVLKVCGCHGQRWLVFHLSSHKIMPPAPYE